MTYGHLQADCLYIGISSGPNVRYRVWQSLNYLLLLLLLLLLEAVKRVRVCVVGDHTSV